MFSEKSVFDPLLRIGRAVIPGKLFKKAQPWYHGFLAFTGAVYYGFPSKKMKVIGVTGTKGKSTVVYMITKILEGSGATVAAVGSLGFKIKDSTWPNTLKMTMPGRWKLQRFLFRAAQEDCDYVVLEVTSEGLAQNRHFGTTFDCAVFTNFSKEHLEAHGSFDEYKRQKARLFQAADNIHILNAEDEYADFFSAFKAKRKLTYGVRSGDVRLSAYPMQLKLAGDFNQVNALAALAVARAYGLDMRRAQAALETIERIPGRMEFVQREPFRVVVDYAHTPDSLRKVYATLRKESEFPNSKSPSFAKASADTKALADKSEGRQIPHSQRLICVLGAAGGGRDKWKRPEFGKLAEEYCDKTILTNEDPYGEDPEAILEDVASGFLNPQNFEKVLDRREAIKKALSFAQKDDTVVITGKGSELSIAAAHGKKIPWSDKAVVEELLQEKSQ